MFPDLATIREVKPLGSISPFLSGGFSGPKPVIRVGVSLERSASSGGTFGTFSLETPMSQPAKIAGLSAPRLIIDVFFRNCRRLLVPRARFDIGIPFHSLNLIYIGINPILWPDSDF